MRDGLVQGEWPIILASQSSCSEVMQLLLAANASVRWTSAKASVWHHKILSTVLFADQSLTCLAVACVSFHVALGVNQSLMRGD